MPLPSDEPHGDEHVFAEALLLSPERRAAYLDRATRGNNALRQRVESWLKARNAADAPEQAATPGLPPEGVLPVPLTGNAADSAVRQGFMNALLPAPLIERTGDTIGRYKLLEQIGEGGFGVVYLAEQREPVKRRVALKIIKPGMDSRQIIARFEVERQALAMMDHPNIAKVLDGGMIGADGAESEISNLQSEITKGRPYFVMELVRGVSITRHCAENNLPTDARLALFIDVCHAIQHAHQKGIIHRDIKPSNILVTVQGGVPVPKVIDFGIAKATQGALTDKTLYTQFQQFIGTPAYISPEQAEMSVLDVDTRSDIYALGVLLYELLVGKTPFDAKELLQSGLDEMRKTIREKEPVRPSTRLMQDWRALNPGSHPKSKIANLKSKISQELSAESRRWLQVEELAHLLRGDLDWIVMKCLEKDRARRYETANGLALDIKRHLTNEPVMARPPSTVYRIQKFVHRNKALVTASATFVLGLVALLIFGSISYQGERRARAAAEQSRTAEISQRQRAQSEAARAEQGEMAARRNLYAADMNLAHQAVDDGNLFRALQLLDRHRLGFGVPASDGSAQKRTGEAPDRLKAGLQTDLRGWEWRYLWKQCEGEQLFILGSHSNGVTAVGFLRDGKTAYSGGRDRAVRLWDIRSQRQVAVLPHPSSVTGVACSPDGRWMATSTEDGANPLLIWDLATQQATKVLLTNAWLRPNSLAFSPDSKLLAFAAGSAGVNIWSLAARQVIAQLPATHQWMRPLGLAFSPDGQTLGYSDNEQGDIVLWSIRNQSVSRRLKGHTWYVTSLAFTPDGQRLVSVSGDRTIKLWDATSGTERTTFTNYNLGLGAPNASTLHLSPDGKMLATGGGQRIIVQELPNGREIIRFRGHTNTIMEGAFSPDGRTFISGSLDGTTRLWDLMAAATATGHDALGFPSGLHEFSGSSRPAFSLSPDGMHLLTVYANRTFSVWEVPALREGSRHPLPVKWAATAALATGGQLAAFVAEDGNVVFWRGDTGETNWFGRPVTNAMSRAVFSLDGKRFAVGGREEVSVWDVLSGKTLFTFPNGKGGDFLIFSLLFSPDSQKLMAGLMSGLVRTWDCTKGAPGSTFRGHNLQVHGLALLPDGRTLVSTAEDIRFWDLKTQTLSRVLEPRPALFRCAAVSPDGRRLAIGANDGLITVYDLASHQEVATLAGHTRVLLALSFLPDGNTLLSIGVDQIRVWRADTLHEADAPSDSH